MNKEIIKIDPNKELPLLEEVVKVKVINGTVYDEKNGGIQYEKAIDHGIYWAFLIKLDPESYLASSSSVGWRVIIDDGYEAENYNLGYKQISYWLGEEKVKSDPIDNRFEILDL